MKLKIALVLSTLLTAAVTMTPAQAEVIELKLGNTTPASGNQSISANEFARRVNFDDSLPRNGTPSTGRIGLAVL